MVLKIKNDIKEAMINKDELTKNTLRMVQSNAQMLISFLLISPMLFFIIAHVCGFVN